MADALELPQAVEAELQAANARRVSEFDGPQGRQYQLWASGRAIVMAELHPDGSVFMWRPLDESNSMAATFNALRVYLAGTS
jgi:hypothetical protein